MLHCACIHSTGPSARPDDVCSPSEWRLCGEDVGISVADRLSPPSSGRPEKTAMRPTQVSTVSPHDSDHFIDARKDNGRDSA